MKTLHTHDICVIVTKTLLCLGFYPTACFPVTSLSWFCFDGEAEHQCLRLSEFGTPHALVKGVTR